MVVLLIVAGGRLQVAVLSFMGACGAVCVWSPLHPSTPIPASSCLVRQLLLLLLLLLLLNGVWRARAVSVIVRV